VLATALATEQTFCLLCLLVCLLGRRQDQHCAPTISTLLRKRDLLREARTFQAVREVRRRDAGRADELDVGQPRLAAEQALAVHHQRERPRQRLARHLAAQLGAAAQQERGRADVVVHVHLGEARALRLWAKRQNARSSARTADTGIPPLSALSVLLTLCSVCAPGVAVTAEQRRLLTSDRGTGCPAPLISCAVWLTTTTLPLCGYGDASSAITFLVCTRRLPQCHHTQSDSLCRQRP